MGTVGHWRSPTRCRRPWAQVPCESGIRTTMRILENRCARIRTGDLTDPNGARYQAALRPDEGVSIAEAGVRSRGSLGRDGLVIAHCEPRHQGLETLLEGEAVVAGVALDPQVLDRRAL